MRRYFFTLVLALMVGSTMPAFAAVDRLEEREVFGFLPYWELGRADGVDLDTLTTLAWFGVEASSDGHLVRDVDSEPTAGWAGWTSDEFAALRTRAQTKGVRVVLVVERFSWTIAGMRATKQAAQGSGRSDAAGQRGRGGRDGDRCRRGQP